MYSFTHGVAIHRFGGVQGFQRGIDLFCRLIEILSLHGLQSLFQFRAGPGMRDHAEILRGSSPDFLFAGSGPESLFVCPGSRGKIPFFMGLDAAVERLFRRDGRFRNGGRSSLLSLQRLFRSRGLRRALSAERKPGTAQDDQESGDSATDGTLGNSKPDQQKQSGNGERITEAVDRFCCFHTFILLRCEGADAFFESLKSRIPGGRADIDSAGAPGERSELFFIQGTVDDISSGIGQRFHPALSIGHLDDGGLGRIADSRDEKRDFAGDDFIDSLSAVSFEFISIGDQHHGAVLGFRCAEGAESGREGLLNIGSSDGDRIDGKLIERLEEAGFVGSQRALEESFSGEGDQSESVAGVQLHQLLHEPLCVEQTRGLDILCQHAFGNIEYEQQIASLSVHLLNLNAPRGPGGGEHQKENRSAEQQKPEDFFPVRNEHILGICGVASEKGLQDPRGVSAGDQKNDKHRGKDPQQMPQNFRL